MADIEKTLATVLRHYPVSNTSRVVVWLTREHGRVSTLIKGSLRPKSWYLGQYDLFYTCELLYYNNPRRELHPAREVSPLAMRPRLRTDWRACATASYLADLLFRISPPHACDHALFDLLNSSLDELNVHGTSASLQYWYELKVLDLLGFRPRLTQCAGCAKILPSPVPTRLSFSIERGGLLCANCRAEDNHPVQRISPAALTMMATWKKAARPDMARRTRCTPGQARELQQIIGRFLEFHLDLPLPSRDIALAILTKMTKVEDVCGMPC